VLRDEGKKLILSHLPVAAAQALTEEGKAGWTRDGFFPNIDAALEWCENRLIAEESAGHGCEKTIVPLEAMDILADFDANELGCLRTIIEVAHYGAGEVIVREADPADSLFLLAAGLVNVCLRARQWHAPEAIGDHCPWRRLWRTCRLRLRHAIG
jgi:hypothetical protein